jgi:hypothetical protein
MEQMLNLDNYCYYIEVTSYVHGAAELLGIQIDAAVSKLITSVTS